MTARILVVDDIAANVRLLEAKLMAEYFEVVSASDGPGALEIAATQSPDIILLDVMMPGMDGFEVARHLKADPKTRHIPIVMVTALTDTEDRVRGLEAGADDFLSKPINDVAMFARVRSLARLKVMMDELRLRHETSGQLDLGEDQAELEQQDDPGHIVLVEATDFVADKMIDYLGDAGHTVARTTSGAAALAWCRAACSLRSRGRVPKNPAARIAGAATDHPRIPCSPVSPNCSRNCTGSSRKRATRRSGEKGIAGAETSASPSRTKAMIRGTCSG